MDDFMQCLSVIHLSGNIVVFTKYQVDVITAFSQVCHVGQFTCQLDGPFLSN